MVFMRNFTPSTFRPTISNATLIRRYMFWMGKPVA